MSDIVTIGRVNRQLLPERRMSVTETIAFVRSDGAVTNYEATVGFDQLCRPREIFLFGAKDGSDMAAALVDTAVALSVALQHGVSASAMARSASRVPVAPDEEPTMPASIVGAALDLLARYETERESVAERIRQLADAIEDGQ